LLEALINDAEQIILSEFPKIQDRIDDDTLSEDLVVMVVSRMVTRVLRNPDNASYIQQNIGPFNQARNFVGQEVDIFLSQDERNLIQPQGRSKAFSINSGPDAKPPTPNLLDILDDIDPVWKPYR
jgi:hypothetical protein